jgi:hypothetical protein
MIEALGNKGKGSVVGAVMTQHATQAVLKRLAVMAVALTTSSGPVAGLADVPESAVESLLEESELEQMDSTDRGRLFRLLAAHPSAHVRETIAIRLLERPQPLTPDVEATLGALVRDPHPTVRWTAISWLGSFLRRLHGMDQLALVSEWAIAGSPSQRLAVACALPRCISPVAEEALELLADDEDVTVRAAALHARQLVTLTKRRV